MVENNKSGTKEDKVRGRYSIRFFLEKAKCKKSEDEEGRKEEMRIKD